ncbi:hypothetical protein K439DRAFT_1019158 [Ramaria rubella]|nr:hypothetical protein K439DRAFT_1019158 [Ramaria rubella]
MRVCSSRGMLVCLLHVFLGHFFVVTSQASLLIPFIYWELFILIDLTSLYTSPLPKLPNLLRRVTCLRSWNVTSDARGHEPFVRFSSLGGRFPFQVLDSVRRIAKPKKASNPGRLDCEDVEVLSTYKSLTAARRFLRTSSSFPITPLLAPKNHFRGPACSSLRVSRKVTLR